MTSPFGRHIASRFAAARHKFYVRAFSGVAPYLLVNEFPKSGGTWLAQMMSEALDSGSINAVVYSAITPLVTL